MKIKKVIFYIFILISVIFLTYILFKKTRSEGFENSYYAFVINLDHRKDRLTRIQNNFKDAPFQLVRFPAIKAEPPQQGCARSFVNLVRMAKERMMPTILVFEDDNIPEPESFRNWTIIKNYLDNHMNDWEIFNGGLHGLSGIKNVIQLENNISLIKSTGGYLTNWIYINNNAYDKILTWEQEGKPLIDLWFMNNFNTYCSFPLLGTQENGFSDIDKSIKNDNSEKENQNSNYKRLLTIYSGSNTN